MNIKDEGLTLILMANGGSSEPTSGYTHFVQTYWERLRALAGDISVAIGEMQLQKMFSPDETRNMSAEELIEHCNNSGRGGTNWSRVMGDVCAKKDHFPSKNIIFANNGNDVLDIKPNADLTDWIREHQVLAITYLTGIASSPDNFPGVQLYKDRVFDESRFEFFLIFNEVGSR